jgi:hypothetical protein
MSMGHTSFSLSFYLNINFYVNTARKLVFGINVYIHFLKTFAMHVCFLSAKIPEEGFNPYPANVEKMVRS